MTASAEDIAAVRIQAYLHLAPVVLLYYDHLLTLPREIRIVWRRARSRGSIWFFLNRYIPFCANIAVVVLAFTDLLHTQETCGGYGLFREIILLLNQVVVCILLILRTCALYGNSRTLVISFIILSIVLLGAAGFSLSGHGAQDVAEELNIPGLGCFWSTSFSAGTHVATAWESQVVLDLVVIVLTMYKSWRTTRLEGRKTFRTGSRLVDVVYRDGAIYFGIMLLFNVGNILSYYLFPPLLKGSLATCATCVSVTMISRVLLNISEAASPPEPDDTISLETVLSVTPYTTPAHSRTNRQSLQGLQFHTAGQRSRRIENSYDDEDTYHGQSTGGRGSEHEVIEVVRHNPEDPG